MAIGVDTKLIPLLGKPLGHSVSPRMQNAAYRAMGFDGCYFPLEVERAHLGEIVSALRWMHVPGFAVTTPHKVEILQYLDELDELAAKMGATNTIVNTNGVLKGYNTDGEGCVRSLKQAGVDIEGGIFFSYGAGGTGRAVCFTLAQYGAKKIYIVSRSDSAERLAAAINASFGRSIAAFCRASEQKTVLDMIQEAGALLNLSGVGMHPNGHESWIDKAALAHKPLCFDASYTPSKTQFLLDAEEMGCEAINGLGMIVQQGALQIELWTGQPAPYAVMAAEARAVLEEQNSSWGE